MVVKVLNQQGKSTVAEILLKNSAPSRTLFKYWHCLLARGKSISAAAATHQGLLEREIYATCIPCHSMGALT
jgi:deoxycytidylate deaminase